MPLLSKCTHLNKHAVTFITAAAVSVRQTANVRALAAMKTVIDFLIMLTVFQGPLHSEGVVI